MYAVRTRDSQALYTLLKKSVKRGEFTLASGKKSDFYVDVKAVSLNPTAAIAIGKILYREILAVETDEIEIMGVGGMELGAVPLAIATAMTSTFAGCNLNAFIVRKEPKGHGMRKYIEGIGALPVGSHVAIVEDVITTGASACTAIQRCQLAELKPVIVIAIVDRMESGSPVLTVGPIPVRSIFTKDDLLRDDLS